MTTTTGRAQAIYAVARADFIAGATREFAHGQYQVLTPRRSNGVRGLIGVVLTLEAADVAIAQAAHLDALDTVEDYLA